MKLDMTNANNSFKYGWLLSRIFPYIKPYLFRIFIGFMVAIPLGLLDGVTAFALKPFMDYVIGKQDWIFHLQNRIIKKATYLNQGLGRYFCKTFNGKCAKENATGLSASAGLVLGKNRNCWEYWKDENGNPLNENKELKKKLNENNIY